MNRDDTSRSNETDEWNGIVDTSRRRFLGATGAALGGLATIGSTNVAAAPADCADGPFVRGPFGAESVVLRDLSGIGRATTPPPGTGELPDEPEGEEPGEEVSTDGLRGAIRRGIFAASRTAQDASGILERSVRSPPENRADASARFRREYEGAASRRFRPSDSQIAVGRDYVVHALNVRLAVFDKRSGNFLKAVPYPTFFRKNLIPGASFNIPFDPRIRYDRKENRYILMTAYDPGVSGATKGAWMVAVSAGEDPLGEWYTYRIPAYKDGFLDYPSMGFDEEAVYLTQNFFVSPFEVTMAIADKNRLYEGRPVEIQNFRALDNPDTRYSTAYTVQPPAMPYGSSTDEGYYMASTEFAASGILTRWKVEDALEGPTLTCESIRVPFYSSPPQAAQRGHSDRLDTVPVRLMNADWDPQDGSLWCAHTVRYTWPNADDNTPVAAVRWYQIDPATASIEQYGTYGQPGTWYFFPTINAEYGQVVLAHNVSGPETYPRFDVAVRTNRTPDNVFGDAETVQPGQSWYDPDPGTDNRRIRWGDYNGIGYDPNNDTFWAVSQYSPDVDADSDLPGTNDYYATRIAEIGVDTREGSSRGGSRRGGRGRSGSRSTRDRGEDRRGRDSGRWSGRDDGDRGSGSDR